MTPTKWTITSGSVIKIGIRDEDSPATSRSSFWEETIPTTDDDAQIDGLTETGGNLRYVAKWGNDVNGNGSRKFPYATLDRARTDSNVRVVVFGSGTYLEYYDSTGNGIVIVGDGHVVFDGTELPCIGGGSCTQVDYLIDNPPSYTVFNNIIIKNYPIVCKTLSLNDDLVFINTKIYNSDKVHNSTGVGTTTGWIDAYNSTFFNIKEYFVVHPFVATNTAANGPYTIDKCSFVNCSGIKFDIEPATGGIDRYVRNTLFKNCNILFNNDGNPSYANYDYLGFHNCNFLWQDEGLLTSTDADYILPTGSEGAYSGASFGVPTGYSALTSANDITTSFNNFYGVSNELQNIIYSDPQFVNIDIGDLVLPPTATDYLTSGLDTDGSETYIGAYADGINATVGSGGGDFTATTNTTFTSGSTINGVTGTTFHAQLTTSGGTPGLTAATFTTGTLDLGSYKTLTGINLFANTGYVTGQYITPDLDLSAGTVSVSTSGTPTTLQQDQAYKVELGGSDLEMFWDASGSTVSLDDGDVFVTYSAATDVWTEFGTSVARPVIATNSYDIVKMRISNVNFDPLGGESGTTTNPTYFKYTIKNEQPKCNRVGNSIEGAITAGDGDSGYDSTNALDVRAQYVQFEINIQNNNLGNTP